MRRRDVLAAWTAAFGMRAAAPPASAQDYPARSIRFVVPFAAGSATDTLARLLGNHVSASLGQSVVIENIGGGQRTGMRWQSLRGIRALHSLQMFTNSTSPVGAPRNLTA